MSKNRRERRQALKDRHRKINTLKDRFYNTATSLFYWTFDGVSNYYNTLASNEIEHLLFTHGMCTVFIDPKDNILKVGRVAGTSKIGQYRQFVEWSAVMGNGAIIRNLNESNAVIVYNNKSKLATAVAINDDLNGMVDTDITIEQHIKAIRIPFVFSGNEDDMLTFKTIYKSVSDGEPVIFTDSTLNLNGDAFRVWNSDINYKGDDLMMLYESLENRIFTHIGIQANRIDKKAQIGKTEVDKNDDVILVNFYSYWSERERARKLIEDVLGVKTTLSINKYLTKQRMKTTNDGELKINDNVLGDDDNG